MSRSRVFDVAATDSVASRSPPRFDVGLSKSSIELPSGYLGSLGGERGKRSERAEHHSEDPTRAVHAALEARFDAWDKRRKSLSRHSWSASATRYGSDPSDSSFASSPDRSPGKAREENGRSRTDHHPSLSHGQPVEISHRFAAALPTRMVDEQKDMTYSGQRRRMCAQKPRGASVQKPRSSSTAPGQRFRHVRTLMY